jgi:hypothetical protein
METPPCSSARRVVCRQAARRGYPLRRCVTGRGFFLPSIPLLTMRPHMA